MQGVTETPCNEKRTSPSCEYVLAALLADRDSATGEQAVTKILTAKKRKARELRVFCVTRLNWQAEHLIDIISWCGQITEPPVTKLMRDNRSPAPGIGRNCPASPSFTECGKVRDACDRGMPECLRLRKSTCAKSVTPGSQERSETVKHQC